MGKPTGFMEYKRTDALHKAVEDRIQNYLPFALEPDPAELKIQAARCMDCGVPFCHAGMPIMGENVGCPLGNLVPEINDLIYRDHWADAYQRLGLTHPFPEITGRVCPALCEGSCTAGQNEAPVTIREIEHVAAEYGLKHNLPTLSPEPATGKRVAVVGSGPSGMAAANQLYLQGHQVTVFEKEDRPGGFLMYGIPNMKLEKEVLFHRFERMEEQGIEFRVNCEIGKDYSPEQLMEDYDAVILCIGARAARELTVPGSSGEGVYNAVDFLTAATRSLLEGSEVPSSLSAKDKHVIIVGGGDTGTDCIATSIRQHASSVTALEIMPCPPEQRAPSNPWPFWPRVKKTDYGHEEAIHVFGHDVREYETTLKEVVREDGKLKGILTVQVEWKNDETGRRVPVEIPQTQRMRPADLILVAMGFTGVQPGLAEQMQLELTPRNTLATTQGDSTGKGGYRTQVPGLFVAGDARRGASLVVWAMQEGMRAANECSRFLEGK